MFQSNAKIISSLLMKEKNISKSLLAPLNNLAYLVSYAFQY